MPMAYNICKIIKYIKNQFVFLRNVTLLYFLTQIIAINFDAINNARRNYYTFK